MAVSRKVYWPRIEIYRFFLGRCAASRGVCYTPLQARRRYATALAVARPASRSGPAGHASASLARKTVAFCASPRHELALVPPFSTTRAACCGEGGLTQLTRLHTLSAREFTSVTGERVAATRRGEAQYRAELRSTGLPYGFRSVAIPVPYMLKWLAATVFRLLP